MIDNDYEMAGKFVINFDSVKDEFCRNFGKRNHVFKSVDAIFINKGDKIILVEFKNNNVKEANIKEKLKDSLLIFTNLTNQDLSFCRENCEYIVVYNANYHAQYVNQETKKQLEEDRDINNDAVDIGYTDLANRLMSLGGKELILWNLGIMKDICVKDVHTYNVSQFKEYFGEYYVEY
ncbi:TPA: hypothetical protein TZ318_000083 [Streptococcus suis]|nr:hypothetical protein [Streptococcus suis]